MELVAGALDAAVQALRDGLGSDDKAARLTAAKALLTRSAANARQQGQGSAGRRETHARGPGQSTRILPSPRGWPPTLAGKSRRLARDRKRGDDGAVMLLGNPSAANRVEEEITKMKKLLLAGATWASLAPLAAAPSFAGDVWATPQQFDQSYERVTQLANSHGVQPRRDCNATMCEEIRIDIMDPISVVSQSETPKDGGPVRRVICLANKDQKVAQCGDSNGSLWSERFNGTALEKQITRNGWND